MSLLLFDSVLILCWGFCFQFELVQDCYVLFYFEGMVKFNDSVGEIFKLVDGCCDVVVIVVVLCECFFEVFGIDEDILVFFEVVYV